MHSGSNLDTGTPLSFYFQADDRESCVTKPVLGEKGINRIKGKEENRQTFQKETGGTGRYKSEKSKCVKTNSCPGRFTEVHEMEASAVHIPYQLWVINTHFFVYHNPFLHREPASAPR